MKKLLTNNYNLLKTNNFYRQNWWINILASPNRFNKIKKTKI